MLAPLAGRIYDHAAQQNAVLLGRGGRPDSSTRLFMVQTNKFMRSILILAAAAALLLGCKSERQQAEEIESLRAMITLQRLRIQQVTEQRDTTGSAQKRQVLDDSLREYGIRLTIDERRLEKLMR